MNLKIPHIIGAILLLVALADLPYGYYTFLRIAITIIAGLTAYTAYKGQLWVLIWVFCGVAVLFNPVIQLREPN